MDTALEKPASKELTNLTSEQQQRLERDRSGASSKFPRIPEIKLANKDETRAPEGEYFIESDKGDDQEPDIRCIGKKPEITILYKTVTYSYFDGQQKKLVAFTTDIHGYGDSPVTVFVRQGDAFVIDFDGTYNGFKNYRVKWAKKDPSTGAINGNYLKRKHVLYVLFEGKPYKMFVTNTSGVGILSDGKAAYDKPQPRSLEDFTGMCWRDSKALYDFAVTMDSRLVKRLETGPTDPNVIYAEVEKPFYIMRFDSIRKLEQAEVEQNLIASMEAEKGIYIIDRMRIEAARGAESKITQEEAAEGFGTDHSVIDA